MRYRRDILPGIAALLIYFAAISCAPGSGYRVATLLFDGVPPVEYPQEEVGQEDATPARSSEALNIPLTPSRPVPVVHKPYLEKRCSSCHNMELPGEMKLREPMLCYSCHVDFRTTYTILHGPVEVGFCSACHDPHSSFNRQLLIKEPNQLCIYCHFNESLLSREIHGLPEGESCSDCHNPHGGTDKRFLKRGETDD